MNEKTVIGIAVVLATLSVPNVFAGYYEDPNFQKNTILIDNCTMPDPKTQCFTKVLDNGTLMKLNGKPEPVIPTTSGERFIDLTVDETDEYVGETVEDDGDGGSGTRE
jgi:hypothetical protein